MAEHLHGMQDVSGSIPLSSRNNVYDKYFNTVPFFISTVENVI